MASTPNTRADVTIAVMGMTGTGKSSFICLVTDDDSIAIGHGTNSLTREIRCTRYNDSDTGLSVDLVDTPGFDDSYGLTDVDILEQIINFLRPENGPEIEVNGLLYMHRIVDPRVGGMGKKNIRLFKSLCGEPLTNVRIITTFWNSVSAEMGEERTKDLAENGFKPLIDAEATFVKHDGDIESAKSIISQLIKNKAAKLQVQKELDKGLPLIATAAGTVINDFLEELKKTYAKDLAALRKEISEAKDKLLKVELAEEQREIQEKNTLVEAEQKKLATSRVGALDRLVLAYKEGKERSGFFGGLTALGGATAAEVAKGAVAIPAAFLGKRDHSKQISQKGTDNGVLVLPADAKDLLMDPKTTRSGSGTSK